MNPPADTFELPQAAEVTITPSEFSNRAREREKGVNDLGLKSVWDAETFPRYALEGFHKLKWERGDTRNMLDYDSVATAFGGSLPRVLGPALLARYAGYFFDDINARAVTTGATEVRFNERYLFQAQHEIERVISHELQHVRNRTDPGVDNPEAATYPAEDLYLFLFHPKTASLIERMNQLFEHYKKQGYPFGKSVQLPSWENKADPTNYTSYDELLALLRGYEVYRRQLETSPNISFQPYEFIEAFQPEDLSYLDPLYRHKLAQEVLSSRPDIGTLVEKDKNPQEASILLENL